MKYTKKRQKQSNKTIPKSIWKLPRDKKSKDEAKNATKGVQKIKKNSKGGGIRSELLEILWAEGTGRGRGGSRNWVKDFSIK